MQGRIFLITGGSSGIGWETVRALAKRQATVVGVSRVSGSGAERMRTLQDETGNGELHHLAADFTSLTDVRRVAEEFGAKFTHLDVLINNAGGFFPRRRTTPSGLELTLTVNHLSHFLLTHLLMDKLLRGNAPRIVVVASNAERFGKIHFDDLMLDKYGMWKAYSQSKLANLLFSYRLARLLAPTPITVNALHPGTVATNIGGRLGSVLMKLARPFFITAEEGAQTTLYLATSPEVSGKTGGYYINQKPAVSTRHSHDEGDQVRLWQMSRDLVELTRTEAAPLDHAVLQQERSPL